jgi:Catalase
MSELIPAAEGGTSPLEQIPDGEPKAIEVVAGDIAAKVRDAAKSAPARRDAHPKSHGCVEASLAIFHDLPEALQQGIFANAASYPCWIRFSNGSSKLQADKIGDGRGMAIKVMSVQGSRSGTQDFIMINNPVFFVRNAADYVDFQKATNPLWFFLPSINPFRWRLHELICALGITRRKVSNPLNTQYWSMTPYLFGERACKFSCRPVGPRSRFEDRSNPDFLRRNMVAALASSDAAFELCIQLQADPRTMPVEDPTILWRERLAPFVPVARLTIPKQAFDTIERDNFGENLSFTPWHGLDAHRPLGGINRARRMVYETISELRHRLNHMPRAEPSA